MAMEANRILSSNGLSRNCKHCPFRQNTKSTHGMVRANP